MKHHHNQLPKPTNQKALTIYLLLERGKKGLTVMEAIKDCMFYKLSARICDLTQEPYNLEVHTKFEKFTNRFGHKGAVTRYFLYESHRAKNLALYMKINKSK